MAGATVGIIIVNWNGKRDTLACLKSVWSLRSTVPYTAILVDNGSTDGSVGAVKSAYPGTEILENGRNLGFAGGNNVGIRFALSRAYTHLWLLNNDTVVGERAMELVGAFGEDGVGAAGSKIYFSPGREFHADRYSDNERGRVLWYAGGTIDWDNMYASHRGVDEVDHGQYDAPAATDFVTGCSMMISSEAVKKTGFLDERYFMYMEDVDYCMRLKANGFRTVYWPRSEIWHVNAGSSGNAGAPFHEYYLTRNRIAFGMRYASPRTRFALVREGVRQLATGNAVRRKAVFDAFTGRMGKRYGA